MKRNFNFANHTNHQSSSPSFRLTTIEILSFPLSSHSTIKIFEPLIDELALFDSSITTLRPIEYFDCEKVEEKHKTTQPTCDMKAILAEIKSELASSEDLTKTGREKVKLADGELETLLHDIDVKKSDEKCDCWSPIVRFVDETKCMLFDTSSAIESSKRANIEADSELKQFNKKQVIQDRSSAGVNHQQQRTAESESESSSVMSSTCNNLNSFKRFLRFFHTTQTEQFESTTSDCSSLNDDKRTKPTTITNDLLESVIHYPSMYHTLREWHLYQDAQSLLGNIFTAPLLVGNRVKVYRSSGTTQWYTAVIISYDEQSRLMTLIDDTVLEEHHEDPTLLEMQLIDDGLIQSIIDGDNKAVNVSTTRRRTQRASVGVSSMSYNGSMMINKQQQQQQQHNTKGSTQACLSAGMLPAATLTSPSATTLCSSSSSSSWLASSSAVELAGSPSSSSSQKPKLNPKLDSGQGKHHNSNSSTSSDNKKDSRKSTKGSRRTVVQYQTGSLASTSTGKLLALIRAKSGEVRVEGSLV